MVEDNPDNRLLLQAMLGDQFTITEYETGPDALLGLVAEPPDLVLLDISLPEMDGIEVLKRLRIHPATAHVPVVAFTAHAMAGDRERFLGEGFDGYQTKPIIDERALVALIDTLVPAT